MDELSLHILDLMQNSVAAGAGLISLIIRERANLLTIRLSDDGKGMSRELLSRVTSPFATTRTARRVGLGIPLFRQTALMSGGAFSIESAEGRGTKITATFQIDNIDRPPMGDLAATMLQQIIASPAGPDYYLYYATPSGRFEFNTVDIKRRLKGAPLDSHYVISWMNDYLSAGLRELNGGA